MSLKSLFALEASRARTKLGLTQQQVAEAISISVRWYQCIEAGSFLPGSTVMLRLILLLQLDVEEFREEAGILDLVLTR